MKNGKKKVGRASAGPGRTWIKAGLTLKTRSEPKPGKYMPHQGAKQRQRGLRHRQPHTDLDDLDLPENWLWYH